MQKYPEKVGECDARIEAVLEHLQNSAAKPAGPLPPARHHSSTANAPAFDARAALHASLGVDLTQIHGLGPSLALKLVGECGTDSVVAWIWRESSAISDLVEIVDLRNLVKSDS